jgi:hypothetical protein
VRAGESYFSSSSTQANAADAKVKVKVKADTKPDTKGFQMNKNISNDKSMSGLIDNVTDNIPSLRFLDQVNWPTVFVSAGLLIGVPYLARRFGLFNVDTIRPQKLMSKATDAARTVAEKVGIDMPMANRDKQTSSDLSTTASH